MTFKGKADGTVDEKTTVLGSVSAMEGLVVSIQSKDWGKALAGDYKSTITFTSEIVVAK